MIFVYHKFFKDGIKLCEVFVRDSGFGEDIPEVIEKVPFKAVIALNMALIYAVDSAAVYAQFGRDRKL